jgi:hypothetical protein
MEQETTPTTALTPDTPNAGEDNASAFRQSAADPAGQTGQSEDKTALQGAPETYEDFTVPDGMALDRDALESFTPVARELNLTQAQAQQLVDLYATQLNALKASQDEQVASLRKGWVESVKADEEIGGAAMNEKLAVAVKALDKFGTPQLRRILAESGLGDHPEMVRVFYRIGKAGAEDKIESGEGSQPPPDQRSPAEILYPNQRKI